jgi:hypothetical protein
MFFQFLWKANIRHYLHKITDLIQAFLSLGYLTTLSISKLYSVG